MGLLVLPDKLILSLQDVAGKPLTIPNVLFRIHTFAQHKNDFDLQPFPTDSEGIATIHKWEMQAEAAAHYDSGLMDYGAIENCMSRVEFRPLTQKEILDAIKARETVWTSLLEGEMKRWASLKDLLDLYRNSNNHKVTAQAVKADLNGSLSEYSFRVAATLL